MYKSFRKLHLSKSTSALDPNDYREYQQETFYPFASAFEEKVILILFPVSFRLRDGFA